MVVGWAVVVVLLLFVVGVVVVEVAVAVAALEAAVDGVDVFVDALPVVLVVDVFDVDDDEIPFWGL